jgi:hypothetical protein
MQRTHRVSGSGSSTVIVFLVLLVPLGALQSGRDVGCSEWRECRQLALAAADQGEYERFHDLAWRAVQLGPPKDSALMSLLARAQALSGRPHDAMVMLDRLAEMGVAVDADTNDDFVRTRQLPGWPEVSAHIDRVRHPDPPAAAAPTAAATAAPATSPVANVSPPAPLEALRFSTGAFTPAGLAYDAVSRRFLFGDRVARKLFVVSERSNRATDFVRAESAGFQEIAAIEVDAKRGDLWVVSAAPVEGTGTLHKLQLVSGRLLRSFRIAADFEPVSLVDLAVTAAGAVLVLDSAGKQLLVLRPGATAFERVIRLDASEPVSLAAGGDEGMAYVAHRDGVSRIDLRARTATPLAAPRAVPLDRLERIRWRPHALIAVRVDEDGTRRITRLDLNASGRAVAHATTLQRAVPAAAPIFVTFWGDELVYLADGSKPAEGSPPIDASRPAEFVAYRLRIR